MINAYDNSIAYTDHVLVETIHWLERHSTRHQPVMLYVSDHGESLGENHLYLHGLPFALAPREQTHAPMVAWFGSGAAMAPNPLLACLRQRRDLPLSHDHLFHTVPGLFGVQASEYQKALDAFAPCRER